MSETNDLSQGVIFPIGEKLPLMFSQYFIGQAYLNMLTTTGVPIGNVTFEPGCRNNWHIHHKGGQILLVTGGQGYYQEWEKEAISLKPGDVVNIAPGLKHWHGADKDSWFSHLAVEVPAEGAYNEWLEAVDDDAYHQLKISNKKRQKEEKNKMNNFVYDIPTKVYFGENQLGNLGAELSKYGKKVLLTYGGGSIKKIGLYDKIVEEINKAGLELFELSGIEPNPRVSSVNAGADICKKENIDVLLAVGGGSVLDCTKYIGAATYYDGDAWDILLQKFNVEKCLPIITVLTLSATGSEMDAGGVISNPETREKKGLIFPVMQPKVSFLDPSNTFTVNPYQTACGTADMMSHLLEVYFNMDQDLMMLDNVMEGLFKTIIRYAPIAMVEPDNYEARANLMWASSWAINGFVRGGKRQAWSCHPMEHELSAIYDITHGLGLAILTPRWMEYTLNEQTVRKFYQFGVNVFGLERSLPPMEVARKSIEMLEDFFFKTLRLQRTLSEIGIDSENFELMAKKAVTGGTMFGFQPLAEEDIVEIFRRCL